MDAIKAIADGIRAERKAAEEKSTTATAAEEKSTTATAADVVQAVAPQQAEKAPKPETEPAEGNKAGSEGTPPAAPEDDTKE